ncbi:hypothetical protein BDQ17DRAFT_1335952 [Cyathus striatus]|nr:hypothetical protein BDQ17DRAFT_1335952 [Cyathus striatus]
MQWSSPVILHAKYCQGIITGLDNTNPHKITLGSRNNMLLEIWHNPSKLVPCICEEKKNVVITLFCPAHSSAMSELFLQDISLWGHVLLSQRLQLESIVCRIFLLGDMYCRQMKPDVFGNCGHQRKDPLTLHDMFCILMGLTGPICPETFQAVGSRTEQGGYDRREKQDENKN